MAVAARLFEHTGFHINCTRERSQISARRAGAIGQLNNISAIGDEEFDAPNVDDAKNAKNAKIDKRFFALSFA